MPRSSRHQSSKHGSQDARDYSESEDDFVAKDSRKGGKDEEDGSGDIRVSKDLVLSEKRKLDCKESKRDGHDGGSGNVGEYGEDYCSSSSKRRKEKGNGDGVGDKWYGGGKYPEEKGDGSRKARGSGELKSSHRRDDGIEEMKKGGRRSERHGRDSSRKEGKDKDREIDRDRDVEKGRDRDRYKERDRERDKDKGRVRERDSEKKGKEGKGEKFIDEEDERLSSKREIATDSKADVHVRNSDRDDTLERRNRKRNEHTADKYQDEIGDVKSKYASSADDVMKDRRKDEKYRDRYHEEMERSRQDKYKDDYPVKDRSRSRSREKYSRDNKDNTDVRQKKAKSRHGDRENDIHSSYDQIRRRDREQDRENNGYWKLDQVSGRDHDYSSGLDHDGERDRVYDRERERDHEHDQESERGHCDERNSREKHRRVRRTSPDEQDEYGDNKARGSKALNSDIDKVSLNSSRIEAVGGGDGSYSRSANVDISPSNRRRFSPTPGSYGDDGYRTGRSEDLKHMDFQRESRHNENIIEATEKSSKNRSSETHKKTDDGMMELTGERSGTSKPSPMGFTGGSPSPSLDRRLTNKSGSRRSLDGEDAGRRSGGSADSRDVSVGEGKSGRDIGVDKSIVEESSQIDSSFSNRQAQGNMNPLPPPFRPGVGSPTFMGMMEEDSRPNSNSRYKRSSDPGMGRGHMNSWRGMPNWPSPLPNGFIPFQSGPPHGNFQPLMPHFPAPPIFGFRPPMEINQPGMQFALADPDRFHGHLRPLGWPNMIDPSGPPRLHGWDVNNGVLRGEFPPFGADWDHNRHPINAREWESCIDMWKGYNGNTADLSAANNKDSTRIQFNTEDGFAGQGNRKSYNENGHKEFERKSSATRPVLAPPGNKRSAPSSVGPIDKMKGSMKNEAIDNIFSLSQFYLSKLNISAELAHPEVYKQYINLLDGKVGLTVDNGPLPRMVLPFDRRGSRAFEDSFSSSVLPTTDACTFQKALELYKDQRLETRDVAMLKIDPLNPILLTHSNDMNKQDDVPSRNDEKRASDMDGEEGLRSSLLTPNPGEVIDGANAVKKDAIKEPGVGSVQSSPQNVSESDTEVGHKWGDSETITVDYATQSKDIPEATYPEADAAPTVQSLVGGVIAGTESEDCGEAGRDGGDLTEGCEVVSDECELVNYGRIHLHSPESTH